MALGGWTAGFGVSTAFASRAWGQSRGRCQRDFGRKECPSEGCPPNQGRYNWLDVECIERQTPCDQRFCIDDNLKTTTTDLPK